MYSRKTHMRMARALRFSKYFLGYEEDKTPYICIAVSCVHEKGLAPYKIVRMTEDWIQDQLGAYLTYTQWLEEEHDIYMDVRDSIPARLAWIDHMVEVLES